MRSTYKHLQRFLEYICPESKTTFPLNYIICQTQ